MLEQKQIEEMSEDVARMLCEIYSPNCDEYQPHSCSKCYVNSTPIGCFVEMLYEAGYRKQSENLMAVVRCCDCKYCEVVIDSIIDEPKYFCTRIVGSIPIDPTDYCSRAKMKGD